MNDARSTLSVATVGDVLQSVSATLLNSTTARLDALILFELATGLDRSRILAELRTPFSQLSDADSESVLAKLHELADRRREGTPIAYITGTREFFSREFAVGPGVLIPRPESEHLVEESLRVLSEVPNATVHDCCCGSGCIGISIAAERGGRGDATRLVLSDISPDARSWALRNAKTILGEPTEAATWRVVAADLLTPSRSSDGEGSWGYAGDGTHTGPDYGVAGGFDLVTANPPYLSTDEAAAAQVVGWGEPATALDGGIDGLELYRRLAGEAYRALRRDGWVIVEHGSEQAAPVRELLAAAGFCEIETLNDLAGLPRLVKARRDAET